MEKLAGTIDRCIAETVAGDRDYFEELRYNGKPELWLQVSWDSFNFALLHDELPVFGELPDFLQVEEYQPGKFVTLSHGGHSSIELAVFLLGALEACWGVVVNAEQFVVAASSGSAQPRGAKA